MPHGLLLYLPKLNEMSKHAVKKNELKAICLGEKPLFKASNGTCWIKTNKLAKKLSNQTL